MIRQDLGPILKDALREVLIDDGHPTHREVIVDTLRFPVDKVPEAGTLIPDDEDDDDVEYVESLIDDDRED
ncbi:MAG: hypothetical protein TQ37_04405 [Candidatus Synechococcus spongiarum 15L]|uniref:Uncharacterized protein n=1 Tax=Candidatus Synechococcus spongiarum 15L TaxID=1608419 RepID=A0A0G8AWS0_9SYNE|nr:MAG: hypothetical protein TQ37_04405 [Candidatus Synechococcus spongiarum 15L]